MARWRPEADLTRPEVPVDRGGFGACRAGIAMRRDWWGRGRHAYRPLSLRDLLGASALGGESWLTFIRSGNPRIPMSRGKRKRPARGPCSEQRTACAMIWRGGDRVRAAGPVIIPKRRKSARSTKQFFSEIIF